MSAHNSSRQLRTNFLSSRSVGLPPYPSTITCSPKCIAILLILYHFTGSNNISVADGGEGYVGAGEPPESIGFAEDRLHLVAEIPDRFEARHLKPDDNEHDGGRDARYQRLKWREAVRKGEDGTGYDKKEDSHHDGKQACLRKRRCELGDESTDEECIGEVGDQQQRRGQREHKGGRTGRPAAYPVKCGKSGKSTDEYTINGPIRKHGRKRGQIHRSILLQITA